MTTRAMLPWAVLVVGLLAPAMMAAGALGTRFGAWDFRTGFQFVFTAAFVAAAVLVLGIAVLVFALRAGRSGAGLPIGAGLAGAVLVLAVLGWQFRLATTRPAIHEVTTDPTDPPAFSAALALRGDKANPLADAETLERRAGAHPRLAPIATALPPPAAFDRAVRTAEQLGWRIVNEDPRAGRVEAVATTFWFGFKDDVAIRVRAGDSGGATVDLRSASRVGESDLGANAARVLRFAARFGEAN